MFGDSFDGIGQAMKFADINLKRFGDTLYKSKFRDEPHDRFANKPTSPAMKATIKYFCIRKSMSIPDMTNMNFQVQALAWSFY